MKQRKTPKFKVGDRVIVVIPHNHAIHSHPDCMEFNQLQFEIAYVQPSPGEESYCDGWQYWLYRPGKSRHHCFYTSQLKPYKIMDCPEYLKTNEQ